MRVDGVKQRVPFYFDNMGQGQYLHEYSAEYATKFIEYLEA